MGEWLGACSLERRVEPSCSIRRTQTHTTGRKSSLYMYGTSIERDPAIVYFCATWGMAPMQRRPLDTTQRCRSELTLAKRGVQSAIGHAVGRLGIKIRGDQAQRYTDVEKNGKHRIASTH